MPNCLHCDAVIETETVTNKDRFPVVSVDTFWVDTLSGDEGGTYDYCPVNPAKLHVPG